MESGNNYNDIEKNLQSQLLYFCLIVLYSHIAEEFPKNYVKV